MRRYFSDILCPENSSLVLVACGQNTPCGRPNDYNTEHRTPRDFTRAAAGNGAGEASDQ
jgi:hypothetical protein